MTSWKRVITTADDANYHNNNVTEANNSTITISGGTALSTGGDFTTNQASSETITLNLEDTSVTAGSYTAPTLTVDAQGRITSASSNTYGDIESVSFLADNGTSVSHTTAGEADFVLTGGTGITTSGNNQTDTITISHADTSSEASSNNSGRTYIQDITLDGFGHITDIGVASESAVSCTTDNVKTALNASTGGLTIGDSSDTITIAGNLTVSGTTTTINTSTLSVEDNIVTLNSGIGSNATPSTDAGIEILRGEAETLSIFWDESANEWIAKSDKNSNENSSLVSNRLGVISRSTSSSGDQDIVGALHIDTNGEQMYVYM